MPGNGDEEEEATNRFSDAMFVVENGAIRVRRACNRAFSALAVCALQADSNKKKEKERIIFFFRSYNRAIGQNSFFFSLVVFIFQQNEQIVLEVNDDGGINSKAKRQRWPVD